APCDATLLVCHSACPEVVPKGSLRLDLHFYHLPGPYSCIAGRAETTCFRHRESLVWLPRLPGLTSAIRESPTPANKVWNTFDRQLPHEKQLDRYYGRVAQAGKLIDCLRQSEQNSELH
ncbi:MAG TPA: hypothetical protein VF860_06570, partial [Candidatus Acidoferrales bacterium]